MEIKTRIIKVYDSGNYVNVSCQSELAKLSADGGVTFFNNECERADEEVAFYVSDDDFNTLSDTKLEYLVNCDCYGWEGNPFMYVVALTNNDDVETNIIGCFSDKEQAEKCLWTQYKKCLEYFGEEYETEYTHFDGEHFIVENLNADRMLGEIIAVEQDTPNYIYD